MFLHVLYVLHILYVFAYLVCRAEYAKYTKYAKYAHIYAQICTNISYMQKYAKSYSIRTHAYICAICIGPGRPAKPGPGGVHILHVFAFL